MNRGYGLVRAFNNEDLNRLRQSREMSKEGTAYDYPASELASYIRQCFHAAYRAKTQITKDLLRNLRQRKGEYEPDKLNKIRKFGGSEVYMMLTSIKCRAAEAWIEDILLQADDKPWCLEPTPYPELPAFFEGIVRQRAMIEAQIYSADPMQLLQEYSDSLLEILNEEAERTAKRMEARIEDQMVQGGWDRTLKDFISDVVTYKAGFIKGPVVRECYELHWAEQGGGQMLPIPRKTTRLEFDRISPFDAFPSPNARTPQEGYFIEYVEFERKDLADMRKYQGYNQRAIEQVLDRFGERGLREWMLHNFERDILEERHNTWENKDNIIQGLIFWGYVSGKMLRELAPDFGLRVEDPYEEYHIEATLVGPHIIQLEVNNNPVYRRPISCASYEEIVGSIWGKGVPDTMADLQEVCNACARALVNNMAIASGPLVEVEVDRLADGEVVNELWPWRIIHTESDPTGQTRHAVQFYQPHSNAEQLIRVFEFFSRLADDYTGIPAYTYGNAKVGGAGRTAAGLSMLFSSASKGIKGVISNIDRAIMEVVERCYLYNMQFDPDPTIKGDAKCVARGSSALLAKEQQQVRRAEFLAMTANAIDAQIMGPEGRSNLLRAHARDLDLRPQDIVPRVPKMIDPNPRASGQPGPSDTGPANPYMAPNDMFPTGGGMAGE